MKELNQGEKGIKDKKTKENEKRIIKALHPGIPIPDHGQLHPF